MGAMIDWSREVATCTPDYYRWNQWLFLQMLERGLAYRAKGAVWWCPKDQTVLANEQVLEGNVCERCGTEVFKRDLEQWYFRITDYAEELLRDAEALDWPERVKTMQRNWIGRSEGARLRFRLGDRRRAGGLHHAARHRLGRDLHGPGPGASAGGQDHHARAPGGRRRLHRAGATADRDRTAVDRRGAARTGVFTGGYAINPVTDERIPVWIADYVLMGYGTGAIMAVPFGDQRDFEFARAFDLPIRVVVQPEGGPDFDPATMTEAYAGPGVLVNSGPMTGKRVPEELPEIIRWLAETGRGEAEVTYRLRDWLISRQRYWGTPIPVVYCDDCGMVPVPEDQLPVELPLDAAFTPTGQSPLVTHEGFLNTDLPAMRRPGAARNRHHGHLRRFVLVLVPLHLAARRGRARSIRRPPRAGRPVDLYCGGIEHAILHLLYARFFTKVMRDLGLIEHGEPFLRLRNQGMILAEEGTKMSKSRGTQIAPDELVAAARRRRPAPAPDVPRPLGAGRPLELARHHRHGALHPPRLWTGDGDRRRSVRPVTAPAGGDPRAAPPAREDDPAGDDRPG